MVRLTIKEAAKILNIEEFEFRSRYEIKQMLKGRFLYVTKNHQKVFSVEHFPMWAQAKLTKKHK